jgi:hypothetical protein
VFLTLLLVTFIIALLVSFLVARLFDGPIRQILARLVPEDLSGATAGFSRCTARLSGLSKALPGCGWCSSSSR